MMPAETARAAEGYSRCVGPTSANFGRGSRHFTASRGFAAPMSPRTRLTACARSPRRTAVFGWNVWLGNGSITPDRVTA